MRARRDGEDGAGRREAVAVNVYAKEGCELCEKAKKKLDLMGVDFEHCELQPILEVHDGWRDDGSIEVAAGYALMHSRIPLIRIDESYHDYSGAMRRLKSMAPRRPLHEPDPTCGRDGSAIEKAAGGAGGREGPLVH